MRLPVFAACVAAALLPPRAAAAQRYVAATNETVISTTEQAMGDDPAHTIYVENRSTVPVTVFSVSLGRCENVRQSCFPRKVNLRVQPGRRELAVRVEPRNREQGFTYYFSFGWHADSGGVAAVAAIASAGNGRAREQIAELRRADSLDRALTRDYGPRARELTRDDFAALAGRAVTLRPAPDSLLLAPGDRTNIQRLSLLVVDSAGAVLGRTRWLSWSVPGDGSVAFTPPDQLVARRPGRAVLRFALADEALALLRREVPEVEVPVRVAYAADPHAPTYAGTVLDADRGAPLACADVALEDTAANVVARVRTGAAGAYRLAAPRVGTYRVRVEASGWAPVYGPSELGGPDATVTREVPVRFTEQLLTPRGWGSWGEPEEFQHATPAAISTGPAATPITLGGSATVPVLGIASRGAAGNTWMQFVVDSAGRVDLGSLSLSAGTGAAAAANVRAVLPRLRFSPARAAGRPTCELVRMQAAFGGR